MAESELLLVRRAVQGDRAALTQLLSDHQQRLYRVALRMVGDHEDATELAQEAMLRIVEHIGSFNGQAAFSTWVTRIVMNLSISHLRKRKLRVTASLDTPANPAQANGQAAPLVQLIEDHREPGPDRRVQQEEMLAQLQTAMDRVDGDLRAVLVLRDIQQMDYAQIAQTLEIPVGTVKSRLFRARLALRRQMYKLGPPGGEHDHQDAPATTDAPLPEPSVGAKGSRPEFPTG